MTNVHKTLTTAVAVILCMTATASGQQPAPPLTADTLSQQNVSTLSQQPEPTPAIDSIPSQPIEQVAINKLNTIAQDLSDTKENTNPLLTPNFWKTIAGLSLIVAIIGVVISYLTYKEQKNTKRNTSLLTFEKQQSILIDLVRHLYRNLVVTRTIETKMRALDFQAYPSEEHLVKLQIPLEKIKLDSFLSTEFTTLSNLYLKFRNYNEEVMIIKDHFKDQTLNQETKKRDLETLTFKCGFLASQIYSFLANTPKKQKKWKCKFGKNLIKITKTQQPQNNNSRNAIRLELVQKIEESHKKNVADYSGNAIAPEIEQAIESYKNEKDHFMKIFESEEQKKAFWEGLKCDIRIECGNKQRAEEMTQLNSEYQYTTDKIYMIKFKPADKTNKTDETNE